MENHQTELQEAVKTKNLGEHGASANALRDEAMISLHTSSILSSRPETFSAAGLTDSVLREFGAGMYDQVKTHPYQLGLEMAAGAAISVAAKSFYAPRVNAVIMAAGAAVGIYEFGKSALGLADQAAVLSNAGSSAEELSFAKQSIRNMGGKTMDVLALTAGGAIANEGIRLALVQTPGLGGGLGGAMPELSRYAIKDGALSASYFMNGKELVPSPISKLVSKWVSEADSTAKRK